MSELFKYSSLTGESCKESRLMILWRFGVFAMKCLNFGVFSYTISNFGAWWPSTALVLRAVECFAWCPAGRAAAAGSDVGVERLLEPCCSWTSTMASLKRIGKELNESTASSAQNGIHIQLKDESNLKDWFVKIKGPDDTPFAKGVFEVSISFSSEYPFKAPHVTFLTKTYHPNIDDHGEVCIALLKEENWKPTCKVMDVLISLIDILRNPNPNDPLQNNIAQQYLSDLSAFKKTAIEWTAKYATSSFP